MKTFATPYLTDERISWASDYLKNAGYAHIIDIERADFILLPIPSKDYMFDGLENKLVFYGTGKHKGIDYNQNEAFLLENAYLTAEGAVALLKNNSDKSIYGSDILITGYGRIAKALHKALQALGANVTICSRKEESKIEAMHNGASHITFNALCTSNHFDVVFNTVPHIVFTKKELEKFNKDTLLIDLASFPGGVDTLLAKSNNIKLIDGRRLPSKYSKISAGILIGKTVDKIIKEDFS
ncbi:MAG: NAD(P)-binding domain-containing protein [Clostridium sp.]|nr:NAD(P)-binding domain-containing protein [Clostridium sp.]